MRLGINALFLAPRPTGIGVFTREISRHLLMLHEETVMFTSAPPDGAASDRTARTPVSVRGSVHLADNLRRFVYTNSVLVMRAGRRGVDVLYCPIMEFPFVPSPPLVITVHDLHPLYYPGQFGLAGTHFRFSLRLLPRRAAGIICPSQYVKGEILNHLPLPEDRVDVVHLGYDRSLFTPSPEAGREAFQLRHGIRTPFILFVGSLFPYKNVGILLDVFREVRRRIPHTLVIIGRREVSPDPPQPDERIRMFEYVEPKELVGFYTYADMLVHPSLAEGFGLTVLEAMACGTPVLSSSAGSLPEVLGDAGILFAPRDAEALARSILTVSASEDLRRDMRRKGTLRARMFSWERAGRAVLASCRKARERSS